MAGVIDAYLAQLGRRLAFDPALSVRVCAEAEDHLREAAEAQPALGRDEAERRAVHRFGSAGDLAARFAADIISARSFKTWLAFAATAGAAFLAMRLRHLLLDGGAFDAAPAAAWLDRFGFLAALIAGIAGWLTARLGHHRLAAITGAIGALALAASIAGGAVIATGAGRQFELATLSALLLEIVMAAWLLSHVFSLAWRIAATERALKG